jgi:hypothetical protein
MGRGPFRRAGRVVTLGASGGRVRPLTRKELLDLAETSPTVNLVTLGRALGVSEPVIREMRRRGQLEEMGIRVLQLGAQYRVPVADILAVLGIDLETATGGSAPPDPPAITPLRPSAKGHHGHDTSAA